MTFKRNNRRDFFKTVGLGVTALSLPVSGQSLPPSLPNRATTRLWYRRPARDWNEALPIGNGRLGAMVFGGTDSEHLQLNEDTLYSDEPGRSDVTLDIREDFERVRRMLGEGLYAEAEELVREQWLGPSQPCYQPLGHLHVNFLSPGEEAWPTQPFPTKPPPYARSKFTVDDINPYLEPEEKEQVRKRFLAARSEGLFTPPTLDRDHIILPGQFGGSNWGGSAADPHTGMLYVRTRGIKDTGNAHRVHRTGPAGPMIRTTEKSFGNISCKPSRRPCGGL
ncbi:MAG: glycoside hydrolase N-terminal domain-containing protein [Acidobacteriota bacterium]